VRHRVAWRLCVVIEVVELRAQASSTIISTEYIRHVRVRDVVQFEGKQRAFEDESWFACGKRAESHAGGGGGSVGVCVELEEA
jgi:hypothetical protein